MTRLNFYTTTGCHLCELAESLLLELKQQQAVAYESIDIAGDERLVELYGIRIPVVRRQDSGRELGWPFDRHDLENLLAD